MSLYDNQSPEEIVYISSDKIARELRHSEPEIKKPLQFSKISGIKKAAAELQKYVEQEDARDPNEIVIGGSSAAFTQIKKFRVPKDLDISAKHLEREVTNIATILRSKYGSQNVQVAAPFIANMGGKDVRVVQIKVRNDKGQFVEAADIKHEVDDGMMSVNLHPAIKIGNIYVEPLGYLLERKASTIKENYVNKIKQGTIPRARVKKDINDFRVIAKSFPDFHRKNLQLEMTTFEKNLTRFDDIPLKDAPKPESSGMNLFGLGSTNPFGTNGFFGSNKQQLPIKKKKLNPLQVQGFKLW